MRTSRGLMACALGLALPLALGGCGAGDTSTSRSSSSGAARSWGEVWHRVRVAITAGRAFDAGLLAARQQNPRRFEEARRTLALIDRSEAARKLESQAPLSVAEEAVVRGITFDRRAAQLSDPIEKARAEEQAAQQYRSALKLARDSDPDGELASSHGLILNALGYFLADRGSTRADFEQGARLARRALQKSDESVSAASAEGKTSETFLSARFERANVRDSVAWALYKIGRDARNNADVALLREAQREQEAALAEARDVLRAWKQAGLPSPPTLSPELPFHLAMILRAQAATTPLSEARALENQARELLREAQALDPDFAPAREALPNTSTQPPRIDAIPLKQQREIAPTTSA